MKARGRSSKKNLIENEVPVKRRLSGFEGAMVLLAMQKFLKLLKQNWKDALVVFLIIAISSVVAIYLSEKLQGGDAQESIASMGILGPIIVIAYTAVSHIVAPLTGTPGIVASLSAFGFVRGTIYIYIGSLISATVNFYIARVLGRKWVIRLSGKKSTNRIDSFVTVMGTKLLIVARLVGFSVFEFISYAAGFTNMSFRRYMAITASLSLFSGTIVNIMYYKALASAFSLSLLLGGIVLAGIIFTTYVVVLYVRTKDTQ